MGWYTQEYEVDVLTPHDHITWADIHAIAMAAKRAHVPLKGLRIYFDRRVDLMGNPMQITAIGPISGEMG